MVENREDIEEYDEYGSEEEYYYEEEEENMNPYINNMYNNGMNMNDFNSFNNGVNNFNNSNAIYLNGSFGGNNIILSTEPFNHSLSLYDHEEKKYLKKGGFLSVSFFYFYIYICDYNYFHFYLYIYLFFIFILFYLNFLIYTVN